jgi:spoIIIJ-associated protein
MESLEVSAKTVEEAIDLALKQLDADREEVDVVVVTEGRAGILGIGSEPAIVRVTPKEKTPEAVTLAKEVLEEMFEKLDVDADVRLRTNSISGEGLSIDILGDDSGLLIGRGGSTLDSLQFMVNFVVSRRLSEWSPVNIDVEGYRQRRYKYLETLAQRLAKRVRSTGRPFTLDPMPANERRIIHLALSRNSQVTTESTGVGSERRLSIRPAARGRRSSRD